MWKEERARASARVMALEIARQSVGGTGKAIRTWAIARYYVDVRDVSSIILIAEITAASTAPTALGPLRLLALPAAPFHRLPAPAPAPSPAYRDTHVSSGFSPVCTFAPRFAFPTNAFNLDRGQTRVTVPSAMFLTRAIVSRGDYLSNGEKRERLVLFPLKGCGNSRVTTDNR